jgi:hypothetical protein
LRLQKQVKVFFFLVTAVAAVSSQQPAAAAAPSPSPSDAPLKEIGRVGSTIYCTMLSKQIAPAVLGLMKNDEVIGAGHRAFTKMSEDALSRSTGHLALDHAYLGQVISAAAHNLELVQRLLADRTYFPDEPQTDEERSALELKARLQAVLTQQNAALNILSGTLETDLMGQMQSELDTNLQTAAGKPGGMSTPKPIDPSQFIGAAGLPDAGPNSRFSTKNLASGTSAKRTIYDSLAVALEVQQRRIAVVERVATQAVVHSAPRQRPRARHRAPRLNRSCPSAVGG